MYNIERFQYATKKRRLENEIVNFFHNRYISGNVVGVAGPAINIHYETWCKLNKKRGTYTSFEIDKEEFELQKENVRESQYPIGLVNDDIENCYKYIDKKISVIDVDLCCALDTTKILFLNTLKNLLRNNKLKNKFGFTYTFTLRKQKDSDRLINLFIGEIITILHRYGYLLNCPTVRSYRDGQVMTCIFGTARKKQR